MSRRAITATHRHRCARTLKITSPGVMPGLCSLCLSNRISWLLGMPRSIVAVSVFSSGTTLLAWQCGHFFLNTTPLPPHLSHVCCICTLKPGAICCCTSRTPLPPHELHFFVSPSLAPVPLHFLQMMFREMLPRRAGGRG